MHIVSIVGTLIVLAVVAFVRADWPADLTTCVNEQKTAAFEGCPHGFLRGTTAPEGAKRSVRQFDPFKGETMGRRKRSVKRQDDGYTGIDNEKNLDVPKIDKTGEVYDEAFIEDAIEEQKEFQRKWVARQCRTFYCCCHGKEPTQAGGTTPNLGTNRCTVNDNYVHMCYTP